MAVDKNLFLHDLAIVAIMKCEAPYLKEWLDYHLLAGVYHFYLYDNDSPDNQAEVAKPYIEAGLVDYFHAPGKAMQMVAYNDAINRFKFHCRYMALIDGDEFIYPKTNRRISEVLDEILSRDPNAAGLEINFQTFGSNGQEKADYSRGVLERFNRRSISETVCKTAFNARKVRLICSPHCAYYVEGYYAVNSNNEVQEKPGGNDPPLTDKIVVNHYHFKSREEYMIKHRRGYAANLLPVEHYTQKDFDSQGQCNEVFDDGILKYRAARADNFSLETDAAKVQRVTAALNETLSRFADGEISDLETALTCRAASNHLGLKIHEEASLAAILKSLDELCFVESRLLISELPTLLTLPYPIVEELRGACLQILPQMIDFLRYRNDWMSFVELDYVRRLLKNFGK